MVHLAELAPVEADWRPRERLLTELLDHAVQRWPDGTAIDFLGRCWTYREIGRLVARAARGLQDMGLAKGDRLALCLPNTPYYVVLYFAALRLGLVVVNLNPMYTAHELQHLLADSGARAIAIPDLAAVQAKVVEAAQSTGLERIIMCKLAPILPTFKRWGWMVLKRRERAQFAQGGHFTERGLYMDFCSLVASRQPHEPVAVSPQDLAVLQYTGGTTGTPKGAMLTHANLAANSDQMRAHLGHDLPHQQRVLGVLPLFHVFALTTVLNFSVEIGAEMVLLPRFDLQQMMATLRRKPPSIVFGVPTIFVAMINGLTKVQAPDFSQLTACVSGGAPLPLEVRAQFEALTGAHVCEGYGLSEASPIIACNMVVGLEDTRRDNSCGKAFPATVLEIRDPDNPHTVLPQGARGEVCARGAQVMAGYWQRPEETAAVFVDGALRTGDIGYLDADGYLYLVDRIKDVILCGGYNVYPRMIEDAAYRHPAVEEAIAIGVPDRYRGQSPKLFVKLHHGQHASEQELRDFVARYVSKIEVPRSVEIRDSLPKSLVGKLSKKELVEEERLKALEMQLVD
jgi:long-chain acyl-CoA synthetase